MRHCLVLVLIVAAISLLARLAAHRQATEDLERCCKNLKSYGTALEIYSMDSEGRYPVRPSALVPGYLPALPCCPTSGQPYQCSTVSNPDLYTIVCEGRHHSGWSPTKGYPGCRVPNDCEHHTYGCFPSPTYLSTTCCLGCIGRP